MGYLLSAGHSCKPFMHSHLALITIVIIDCAACPFPKHCWVLCRTQQSHEAARAGIIVIITIILLLMQIGKPGQRPWLPGQSWTFLGFGGSGPAFLQVNTCGWGEQPELSWSLGPKWTGGDTQDGEEAGMNSSGKSIFPFILCPCPPFFPPSMPNKIVLWFSVGKLGLLRIIWDCW